MSDRLLTSLCGICHTTEPKYKCPRCALRSCSLPCSQKHKAWSECSGVRDATAYVPPAQLRTPAGVDHDYNFLKRIERDVEVAETIFVEERGLLTEADLKPDSRSMLSGRHPDRAAQFRRDNHHHGRGGGNQRYGAAAGRPPENRSLERFLARGLYAQNTKVLLQQKGMQRREENGTSFNRRLGRINWQVEWLLLPSWTDAGEDGENAATTRILSKVAETVVLYKAFEQARKEHTAKAEAERRKSHEPTGWERISEAAAGQGVGRTGRRSTSRNTCHVWAPAPGVFQSPDSATWSPHAELLPESTRGREDPGKYRFFLAHARRPKTITEVGSGDTLQGILADTRVLEFPTLYVLPAEEGENKTERLLRGLTLGPKDEVPPPPKQTARAGDKRKRGGRDGKWLGGDRKKRAMAADEEAEEGEVVSGDKGEVVVGHADENHETGSSGSDLEGMVAGPVDEDDGTSSSGSDSSEDESGEGRWPG